MLSYDKGSSAGTSFADILFVVAMCRVLNSVYSELRAEDLCYQFPFRASSLISQEEIDGIRNAHECSNVDDAVFWHPFLPRFNFRIRTLPAKFVSILSNTF